VCRFSRLRGVPPPSNSPNREILADFFYEKISRNFAVKFYAASPITDRSRSGIPASSGYRTHSLRSLGALTLRRGNFARPNVDRPCCVKFPRGEPPVPHTPPYKTSTARFARSFASVLVLALHTAARTTRRILRGKANAHRIACRNSRELGSAHPLTAFARCAEPAPRELHATRYASALPRKILMGEPPVPPYPLPTNTS